MSEEKNQVEATIKNLIPEIKKSVKTITAESVEAAIEKRFPDVKKWIADLISGEIAAQLDLPPKVVSDLQNIDALIVENKSAAEKAITELVSKIEAFKDRLKGIDVNKTLTMSYGELQKIRVKVGVSWGVICYWLGVCSGFMILLGILGRL